MRTLDPAPFNAIARHPEVQPWLGLGDATIDLAPVVSNPENVCLLTPERNGGYVLQKLGVGLYCVHSMATPEGRGSPMMKLMFAGLHWMFTATDAVEIVSCVPDGNVRAMNLAKLAGFRETFRRERAFVLGTELVGAQYLSLAYPDWVTQGSVHLTNGRDFGEFMAAYGHLIPSGADLIATAWIGAAVATAREGNVLKAVSLYNRWAALAGYAPWRAISVTPAVVDIGGAIIGLSELSVDPLWVARSPEREEAEGLGAPVEDTGNSCQSPPSYQPS